MVWMRTMEWSVPVLSRTRNINSTRLSAIAWKPRGQSIAPARGRARKKFAARSLFLPRRGSEAADTCG